MAADRRFKFLSVFKWETRKGWDVLLRAFLAEFSPDDGAALYIKTSAYHSDSNFRSRVETFAQTELGIDPNRLSHVVILAHEVPLGELPRLYRGADVFVLPSRGEGWGRPHIEAMAMGLPCLATNWSGNTEFMLPGNSFLIPIDGLEEVREGAFKGHFWASPSVHGLRQLMREVFTHRDEAGRVGQRGRAHVTELYNPAAVGRRVLRELRRIEDTLARRGALRLPSAHPRSHEL